MDKKYFNIDDITKIDAFLSIPKVLFTDDRYKHLGISAKLIFALYLNRYTITKYVDETGPYIVYNDKDIVEKLCINRATCSRARSELIKVGLISTKRSVGNNKIYLYSFSRRNGDTAFFYEDELDSFQFYRFPTELFEDKYKNLPLNAKLIYSIYFDTMCLSQMNYFVDDKERIYFQESVDIQEKKIGLTPTTIRTSRNFLKVCELLFEVRPFGQDMRFYPLKLSNFIDRVQEYNALSKAEQKEYMKTINKTLQQELIVKPQKFDYIYISKMRVLHNLTTKEVVRLINKEFSLTLSVDTYRRYESGVRNFPERIYVFLKEFFENLQTHKETDINMLNMQQTGQHFDKIATQQSINMEKLQQDEDSSLLNLQQTSTKNSTEQVEEIETNISKNYCIYNYDTKTYNKTKTLLINLIDDLNTFNYNSQLLEPNQKEFLSDCLQKVKNYQKFYMSKQEVLLNSDELFELLNKIKTQIDYDKIVNTILLKIKIYNYTFKTPDSQINCFLTFLFNEMKNYEGAKLPDWFHNQVETKQTVPTIKESSRDFEEDIKEFNWWD